MTDPDSEGLPENFPPPNPGYRWFRDLGSWMQVPEKVPPANLDIIFGGSMSRQVQLAIPSLKFSTSFYLSEYEGNATPELIAEALRRGEYKLTEIVKVEEEIEIL